jgi:hypothetical protein
VTSTTRLLVKIYGQDPEPQRRYSPAVCTGTERSVVTGDPDPALISASYIERQNLTMRMSMRRFTRLTNAFSKMIENHAAAVALHFQHYNFARPQQEPQEPLPSYRRDGGRDRGSRLELAGDCGPA